MEGTDSVERALGRLEGKIDALDTKVENKINSLDEKMDIKFDTFKDEMHKMDTRVAIVEATTLTPKRLLGILVATVTIISIVIGAALTVGDRLWGG